MEEEFDDFVKKHITNYLQHRAIMHMEAAIGSMVDAFPTAQAVEIIRELAEHLEDHS